MMRSPKTNHSRSVEQVAEAVLAGLLLSYAPARRRGLGTAARVAGAGLLIAAFAPVLSRRLRRAGAARRRIELRTAIDLDRPVHEVFEFCRDFENFPRVVQSLRSVTDYQDGRSRWEVISPAGELLAWDAQVTKYVPNVVLAWRSIPGSVVDCNGLIRFSPGSNGGTHLEIEIDYDPCHTGLSDAVRALFDVSRNDQLQADLARANFYLTTQPRARDDSQPPEDSDLPTVSA
jgi:uncharacterized membrane protein